MPVEVIPIGCDERAETDCALSLHQGIDGSTLNLQRTYVVL